MWSRAKRKRRLEAVDKSRGKYLHLAPAGEDAKDAAASLGGGEAPAAAASATGWVDSIVLARTYLIL